MNAQKKHRILVWISVAAVVILTVCGGFVLQMGGRTGEIYADAELLEDGNTRICVGVTSSAGYVRTMKMRIEGEDAYLDFYRTFGINQPLGAKHEFIVRIPDEVQRICVWQCEEYRVLHERNADGSWEKVKE